MQMKIKYLIFTILVLATFSSCRNARTGARSTPAAQPSDSLDFTLVQVPAMITDQQEVLSYSMEHFWDRLSEKCYAQKVEEQFANWIWLSENVPFELACKSLKTAYSKSPERILYLAEKYLYDPQSPYRNEDLYGSLCALVGGDLEDVARLCALNPVGGKAADFTIEDARGRHFTLYSVKARYTLLFFSNPYCHACKEIIDALKANELVQKGLSEGVLAVVNMYTDEDLEQWRSYLAEYPKSWKTGFDPTFTLQNCEKYNIRAIPSLYLLGEDKTVLLKDAPTEKLMNRLQVELQRYL